MSARCCTSHFGAWPCAGSSQPSLEAAAALLERSCNRLAELLIQPLARDLDGRDLVIVPTGELHAIVWGLLPSLRGRAVTVSPSASLWYSPAARGPPWATARRPRGLVRSCLSPGRGLLTRQRRSRGSARLSTRRHGHCKVRPRPRERLRVTFEGRRLVHVAAHGTFRADNPQFSSLEMADGPITVYDLERIARPPEWIVLSACDAGRAEVHPGDELMGTSAALLSLGTRAIVSSARGCSR